MAVLITVPTAPQNTAAGIDSNALPVTAVKEGKKIILKASRKTSSEHHC